MRLSITTNQHVDLKNVTAYSSANIGRYPELILAVEHQSSQVSVYVACMCRAMLKR